MALKYCLKANLKQLYFKSFQKLTTQVKTMVYLSEVKQKHL